MRFYPGARRSPLVPLRTPGPEGYPTPPTRLLGVDFDRVGDGRVLGPTKGLTPSELPEDLRWTHPRRDRWGCGRPFSTSPISREHPSVRRSSVTPTLPPRPQDRSGPGWAPQRRHDPDPNLRLGTGRLAIAGEPVLVASRYSGRRERPRVLRGVPPSCVLPSFPLSPFTEEGGEGR